MPYIDTHAHLNNERFAPDLPAVLDRARAAGLIRVLTIGIRDHQFKLARKPKSVGSDVSNPG